MLLRRLVPLIVALASATVLAVPAEAATTASSALAAPRSASVDTQSPSTPSNLTVVAVTSTTIQLRWEPSTDNVGVTGYDILRAQGRQSHRLHATVAGTTFVDTDLVPQVTYSYY